MIGRSPHTAWLARALLDAMGLGIATGLVACGGKVVVDADEAESAGAGGSGSGGDGGAGAVGTTGVGAATSSSTGPQPPPCKPFPPNPGNQVVSTCVPSPDGGCPLHGTAEASNLVSHLESDGPCPTDPEFCWCSTNVVEVMCGPEPSQLPSQCCYDVEISQEEICMGRPFTVAGAARTARAERIAGWSVDLRPDVSSLDDATRARLAAEWTNDALMEHASVASFARAALEWLALGAPADLIRGAQKAMGDEILHAELCFGLASVFACEPVGPGALPIDRALDHAGDPAAIAAAVVREGCIGETLAALLALEARDVATDPAVKAVLDRIATDEAAHAALAWRWIAWIVQRGDARVVAAIRDAFESATAPAIEDRPHDLRAFGRLSADDQRRVLTSAFADVIAPCVRALFSDPIPIPRPIPRPRPRPLP